MKLWIPYPWKWDFEQPDLVEASLPMVLGLELYDLYGSFQPKHIDDSAAIILFFAPVTFCKEMPA